MSIRIAISNIKLNDETLLEVSDRINYHLSFYSKSHPEFSYQIEELIDSNELIIKTINLEENVN